MPATADVGSVTQGQGIPNRLATSICQLRYERVEHGPTEPHAGRGTFLLSSGDAGVSITQWPLIPGRLLLRSSFPVRL